MLLSTENHTLKCRVYVANTRSTAQMREETRVRTFQTFSLNVFIALVRSQCFTFHQHPQQVDLANTYGWHTVLRGNAWFEQGEIALTQLWKPLLEKTEQIWPGFYWWGCRQNSEQPFPPWESLACFSSLGLRPRTARGMEMYIWHNCALWRPGWQQPPNPISSFFLDEWMSE